MTFGGSLGPGPQFLMIFDLILEAPWGTKGTLWPPRGPYWEVVGDQKDTFVVTFSTSVQNLLVLRFLVPEMLPK